MSRPVRTSSQIAECIGRGLGYVEALMQESERDGIVERVGEHGWRLTDRGFDLVQALAEDAA